MNAIEYDDWNMLNYFWKEKGNLERWCGWDEFKAANPRHPVVEAWERHKAAEAMLDVVVKGSEP